MSPGGWICKVRRSDRQRSESSSLCGKPSLPKKALNSSTVEGMATSYCFSFYFPVRRDWRKNGGSKLTSVADSFCREHPIFLIFFISFPLSNQTDESRRRLSKQLILINPSSNASTVFLKKFIWV
ncbi:unnamed protein product [Lactuca virosa]|uniref:Uncharacterized protein n=1 Tax=Lactuca virosa TaxID=75947 RepID=A0AAU9PPQ7_9ASTR|nr:unnamed protein product [Lactuca virosa]